MMDDKIHFAEAWRQKLQALISDYDITALLRWKYMVGHKTNRGGDKDKRLIVGRT